MTSTVLALIPFRKCNFLYLQVVLEITLDTCIAGVSLMFSFFLFPCGITGTAAA